MSTSTDGRTATNLEIVGGLYEAFGRGDMESILALIDPDCAWESWLDHTGQKEGLPYLQPQRGPEGVGAFFAEVAKLEIHDFQVLGIWGSGEKVAVEVLIEASTPAGGRFRDEELHVYTVADSGKIVAMRHYIDTAKHIAASRGES